MSDAPEIHGCDKSLILASWRDFFWICWLRPGDPESAERAVSEHRRYVDARPHNSTVVLTHVTAGATMRPPDDVTREELRKHVPVIARTRAAVTVIDGTGFGAAIVRGLVSWFTNRQKTAVPHEVHATAREGLAFLLSYRDPSHPGVTIDEALRAYDHVVRSLPR